jgi:hypothetical protein
VFPGAGSNGSNTAHWASVNDDDGYTAQRCPSRVPAGQDGHTNNGDNDMRVSWERGAGLVTNPISPGAHPAHDPLPEFSNALLPDLTGPCKVR